MEARNRLSPPPRAADLLVPGRPVADADVDALESLVVGHGIPHRAATAVFPPFAGPGLRGHRHGLVLEAPGRVARHGVEAPELLAGRGVVGRDITAQRAVVGPAEPDDDLAVEGARRAHAIGFASGVDGLHAPVLPARAGVERDQPAVHRSHEDPPVEIGQVMQAEAGAQLVAGEPVGLGIVFPQQLSAARVDRMDHRLPGREVQHAVDHQGRAEAGEARIDVVAPAEAQALDVAAGDPVQAAVVGLAVRAALGEPVRARRIGGDARRRFRGARGDRRHEGQRHRGDQERANADRMLVRDHEVRPSFDSVEKHFRARDMTAS